MRRKLIVKTVRQIQNLIKQIVDSGVETEIKYTKENASTRIGVASYDVGRNIFGQPILVISSFNESEDVF